MAAAERRYEEEREAGFRRELATVIRSASPFLVTLASISGLTLDDVAARLVWYWGWPKHPRLPDATPGRMNLRGIRHGVASGKSTRKAAGVPAGLHTGGFKVAPGGWARTCVLGHSLEVSLTIGSLTFETVFGELLVHIRGGLPQTLAAAAVGRPLEDFVLHPASSGRGWLVDAIETRGADSVLIVFTGSTAWRPA